MNISSIGKRPDQAMLQLKQASDRGKSGISQELKEKIEVKEKIARTDTGETAQVQEEGGSDKGVVGLLQEGHFQGVADIRLRINFYEQLQNSMSQKSEELLRTGSQELMGELEGQMQDFGEEFQVTDQVKDLLATFKEETDGLFASSEGEVDSSSVIGGLRDAFAGFIASLGSLAPTDDAGEAATGGVVVGETTVADNGVPIAENDPAVAETDSTEPEGFATTEEPDAFSLALQDLQEWFDTEISAMEKTVDDLHVTPEPREPSGNGVAYDRFLGIYRELETGTGSTRTHGKA